MRTHHVRRRLDRLEHPRKQEGFWCYEIEWVDMMLEAHGGPPVEPKLVWCPGKPEESPSWGELLAGSGDVGSPGALGDDRSPDTAPQSEEQG